MNPSVVSDVTSIPAIVSRLAGAEVSALAMVCAVGEGAHASITAFITPGDNCSASFRNALEMEGDYSDALLSFDENLPPYYGDSDLDIDLSMVASIVGVDRVICLVTQVGDRVSVVRDYDGLEVTLIEATKIQFDRFVEILDGVGAGRRRFLH
ncbi:hypothetical protein [Sulfuricystis multivorans]|uniref:hypothetical protein n=1 Tax=Sulfuricystis multivorans TaxID=2211108 RepID=UPI000F826902|nr:hypothetical protein [Sulfuricystis multivorans]